MRRPLDHTPAVREGLLVWSSERRQRHRVFLSSEVVSGDALFALSGKNLEDRDLRLWEIQTHTVKETPQGPFGRMNISVRDTQ